MFASRFLTLPDFLARVDKISLSFQPAGRIIASFCAIPTRNRGERARAMHARSPDVMLHLSDLDHLGWYDDEQKIACGMQMSASRDTYYEAITTGRE